MADNHTSAKFVDDLGKVKDAIGEWHDWEELVGIATEVLSHRTRCGLQSELRRITQKKYDHALSLIDMIHTHPSIATAARTSSSTSTSRAKRRTGSGRS